MYNFALAVVVPDIELVAGVKTPETGEVITGAVRDPASEFGPLPAAQKYAGDELQPVTLSV